MTDEELDLLASAYVDGEATPDEVALVEGDPELQARVEVFRAVRVDEVEVTPPPGLMDRHVAAALAEVDATAGSDDPDEVGTTAPVVDLRDAASRRGDGAEPGPRSAERVAGRTRSRSSRTTPRTMPSWLPAAAGFVIVGGGFLWAIGQTGGDDDDSADTEAAAISTDDSAEEPEDEAMDEGADDSAAMSAMAEDDAMEEADDGDDAGEEEAEEEAADRTGADADAAAPADEDEPTEDAEEGLVEPQPLLFFDEIPDVDAIDELPEPEADLERSLCGPEIVTGTLGQFIGFVPVLIRDRPAEIYLFEDGDGAEIRLLIDEDCQPLEPRP